MAGAYRLAVTCSVLLGYPCLSFAQDLQSEHRDSAGNDEVKAPGAQQPARPSLQRVGPHSKKIGEHRDGDANVSATGDADARKDADPLSLGPLHFSMFVDAYAAWQTGGEGTLATLSGHRAFTGQGAMGRSESGLGLSFLGFDAEYDAGSFGAIANLRFGPAATIFHGDNDSNFGVNYLTQAYAFYRPVQEVQLDLGMFMSPFGFEALESWKNPNYTISALYTYGQPNWHTGARATWKVDEELSLMALVVNGANNISETQQQGGLDQKPMVGGSISYEKESAYSLTLGGLAALDHKKNDDEGIDAFLDFVATYEVGSWITALNLDYIYTRDGAPDGSGRHYLGGSLTASYRFNDIVGLATRAEYMRDDADFDGQDLWQLGTGTLTVDVAPIPRLPNLIVRWENRVDRSNQRVFGKDSRGTEETEDDTYGRTWFESVLGVVVTTKP